jgi:putative sterol carrier protein
MTNATAEFFQGLAERGHEPALQKATGTLRFDLSDGAGAERWLITIKKGAVAVSRKDAKADCIASGEANAMSAFLRGAIEIDGDRGLLLAFQRVFPGPARKGA